MTPTNGYSSTSPRTTMVEKTKPRPPNPPRKKKKQGGGGWLWFVAIVFGVLFAAAVALVIVHKLRAQTALNNATRQMATPSVLIVHPEAGAAQVHLVLPGTVESYIQSTVYAQVTGYLKRWLVDIGAPVKKGQLLAEIETPETDQQLAAAQATQAQNQASVDLAQVTANRYNVLLHTNAVAQQDVDEKNGDLAVAQANLDAAKANVGRLQKTEAFKEVYAPFDGTLTQRNVDIGDLVTAGSGTQGTTTNPGAAGASSSSHALFQIAQTTTLRVYVRVPEMYSDQMTQGLPAKLQMASNPDEQVPGTLVRTSKAIDPSSLTLLAEIDVDNQDGKLFPGGYAQVRLDITLPRPPVVLPGNTLIFRSQGTQVGIVDSSNTVHLKDIKIGRDFGTKIEVVNGIEANDNVVLNPSDSLTDGEKVQIDTSNQPKSP